MMLEEITFFAGDYPGPSFTMKVWIGSNATEVSSEPVASFVQNDWNTVALSTPVMIDASQDLWFGYETTHAAGEYPAGCDAGPAIQTYGDMILNGGAWSSLYVLTGGAIDANWNIVGSASFADGSKSTTNSVVMSKPIAPVKSNGSLSALGFGSGKKYIPSSAKGVDGYNVYRDGSKINSAMVLETTYTDVVGVSGIYVYNVTAIWDGGTESGYSDPWTVEVITGVDEQVQSATQVFPNPAKELVNIASEFTINSVIVYNFSGQVVANEKVNGNEYQVNVNQYQPGIYVFQISTAKGIANYRIVVE
ncbi:MAG: T9SS type A sorting domain-containing protein [Bacteroidales bacterium]